MTSRRLRIAAFPAAFLLATAVATVSAPAPALAQIPDDMTLEQIQSILSAPISVPAGETVSVEVGVPVSGAYQGDGWDVASGGTTVTVTAPDSPGAQVSVPMTAVGQTATITLVAEQNASNPIESVQPEAGPTEGGADGAAPAGEAPAGEAPAAPAASAEESAPLNPETNLAEESEEQLQAAPEPVSENQSAESEDAEEAEGEFIDLEATIEGNVLSAKLGLGQAASLAARFSDLQREDLDIRYRDADGNQIENVERNIDTAALSLTLTYPEGETPDNPFFVEVLRGEGVIATVRLTAPNAPITAQDTQRATQSATIDSDSQFGSAAVALGGVLALVLAGVAGFFFWRRRSAADTVNFD